MDKHDPAEADHEFFQALLAGDAGGLDRLLTEDFVLIDVMSGSLVEKPAFLELVRGAGAQLRFDTIEPAEIRVRRYGTAAVVTGRTEMAGRFGEAPFAARSRYTHVYAEIDGRWRLASAQGTPISGD